MEEEYSWEDTRLDGSATTDLLGESSGHRLYHGLQILLPSELALQEVDPLLDVGALLMS